MVKKKENKEYYPKERQNKKKPSKPLLNAIHLIYVPLSDKYNVKENKGT